MTIQKQSAPSAAHSTDAALTGSSTAQSAAAKARAALETIVSPAITPKLSELPTTKERLLAVADAIEHEALVKKNIGFNMSQWYYSSDSERPSRRDKTGHECGTIACIAGWTALMEDGPDRTNMAGWETNIDNGIPARARVVLGISRDDARHLFTPEDNGYGGGYSEITPAHAVAVIRHYAETGTIRWNNFDSDGKPK